MANNKLLNETREKAAKLVEKIIPHMSFKELTLLSKLSEATLTRMQREVEDK